jgi:hypothetical protein
LGFTLNLLLLRDLTTLPIVDVVLPGNEIHAVAREILAGLQRLLLRDFGVEQGMWAARIVE